MSRVPIRLRLTGAFAFASALILALAGAFVYLRVGSELEASLDESLEARAGDLVAVVESGSGPIELDRGDRDPEEVFSQVLATDGRLIATSSSEVVEAAISGAALERAREERLLETIAVAGADGGEARVLATGADRDGRELVVVAGASTEDRDEALAGLLSAFAIGGPLALALAAGLGYGLAASSLRPVERMRRRAGEITLAESGERLPVSDADDEISRLGTTLNEMLARIEASLEQQRRFVADASHELRTPLTVLRAELELGTAPGVEPEQLREALRSGIEEADRLARLADDLLTLARSEDGRLAITRERLSLGSLLETVAERFRSAAAARGRTVTTSAAAGLERVELDRLRVEQAVANLIDNALRHGGGAVTVSARAAPAGVEIEVRDEGEGFEAAFAERAFERFSRAESGRPGEGAGLGLAIVAAIAEAHGGDAAIAADRRSVVVGLGAQASSAA